MRKVFKKITALVLAATMMSTLAATSAFADDAEKALPLETQSEAAQLPTSDGPEEATAELPELPNPPKPAVVQVPPKTIQEIESEQAPALATMETPEQAAVGEVESEEQAYYAANIALVKEGDAIKYYENGVWITTKYGYVDYDGGKFLVANGVVATHMNGLQHDPNNTANWYYLSNGQVQNLYTGLVEYDGAWFFVVKGKLDTTQVGLVEYDDNYFYIAAGRVVTEANGLVLNPLDEEWYYVGAGMVQLDYYGLAEYDGKWFFIFYGWFGSSYTGYVDYNGGCFYVVNGTMVNQHYHNYTPYRCGCGKLILGLEGRTTNVTYNNGSYTCSADVWGSQYQIIDNHNGTFDMTIWLSGQKTYQASSNANKVYFNARVYNSQGYIVKDASCATPTLYQVGDTFEDAVSFKIYNLPVDDYTLVLSSIG